MFLKNKILVLFIVSMLFFFGLQAQNSRSLFPSSADDKKLLFKSLDIYNFSIAHSDSAATRKMLHTLIKEARSKNQPAAVATYLGLEADYLLEKGNDQDSLLIIQNYEQALQIARKHQSQILTAWFEYKTGKAYYRYNYYQKGLEHLFAAAALLNEIGIDQIPEPERYLLYMGNMYCDFQDYRKGLYYLKEALKYPAPDGNYSYELYGTLGLAYFRLHQNDSAVFYSKKGMEVAYAMKDTVKAGSISGNIGAAYYELKDYTNALHYLREDYNISRSRKNWISACGSVFFVAQVYNQLGETNNAGLYLDTMKAIFTTYNCANINNQCSYYGLRTILERKRKNYEQALVMQDSYSKYNDLYRNSKNIATLKTAELKTSRDLAETKIRLAENQRKKQILFRNGIIIVALLIIIIIVQALYRLRQKQKAEHDIFTLQLENAEKQLAIYVESLREKTRLLEQFNMQRPDSRAEEDDADADEIADDDTDIAEPAKTDALNRIKDVTLITEDAWREFTALVNLVHKDFLPNLKKKYPNLTPGDIRLLTLIKLDFSKQEMAATLGISPDSVKKARQRVRKKLDIDEHTDIKSVLSAF